MKTFVVEGTLRKDLGKKASKDLRKDENIPCVIYGGKENINFFAAKPAFKHLVYTPHVYLVDIKIGKNSHLSVMQEIQFHPVSDEILHIDFIEVAEDREVIIDIPVKIVGNSIGVKKGGKVRLSKRTLKVKALPKNLPDLLDINIEDLDIGQNIKVGDLNFNNLTLLGNNREPIVAVMTSRVVAKGEGEEEAAAGAAAPAAAAAAPAAEKK